MARIIIFLLCLLLRNNAYAWYCNYVPQQGTGYVTNLACYGIDNQSALSQAWCPTHPNDPICEFYYQPACQSQTEYQSLGCLPHFSGAINQSRSYACTSQSWTAWTTTSDNCTPDPPTCIQSTETRTLTCSAGFEGSLQEQRNSICSDPYGSPTWTTWLEIYNTCKMTATNLNNPTSPISPISPTNPNSVISQQVTTAPIIQPESVTVSDITALTPTVTETPATSVATVKSEASGTISAPSPASTTTTSGTDKKDTPKGVDIPKGKDIVPGFGIVMSMQLLNQGYNLQQEQMKEYINLIQEQEYGQQQNILLEFISANDTGDRLFNTSAIRWRSILRDNPLQRFDLDD